MEKSANEVSISKISVKREHLNDDIKDYAETAMNELLGWYGYDNPRSELMNSRNCRSHSGSNSSGPESPKFTEGCGWCGKSVEENSGLSSAAATFCSELCFSQSRRANFKKNKTCDWCRHVRHTVSYVDFQDGASQLQFCSDKCLNQYKMHIFCRETRAHLEIHPHVHGEESSSGTLITPDLWLKNCKSPERRTPSPTISITSQDNRPQTSPLPLITVAHPSKLMPVSNDSHESKRSRFKLLKKTKKRCSATVTCNNFSKPIAIDAPQDLRIRHTPVDIEKNRFDSEVSPKILTNDGPKISSYLPHFPAPSKLQNSFIPNQQLPCLPPPVKKPFDAILPPPTVLVPYPIILPLPIPIPIPIPIPDIFKKDDKIKSIDTKDVYSQTDELINEKNSNEVEVVEIREDLSREEEEEEEESQKNIERPLRKRRKIFENRPKILVRPKKVNSHT